MDQPVGTTSGNGDQSRNQTSGGEEEDMPACQSCKKRKLKCSREIPSCSQCSRLSVPCLYDHKKLKPGVKSGVIDSINRRLEALENILLDSQGNQKSSPDPLNVQGCVYHASLLIANELKNVGAVAAGLSHVSEPVDPQAFSEASKLNCQNIPPRSNDDFHDRTRSEVNGSRKRKHQDEDHDDSSSYWRTLDDDESLPSLPPEPILEAVIKTYFSKLQPWIPFLHKPTFEAHMKDPHERPRLTILLHAIVSATMKHVNIADFGIHQSDLEGQIRVSRNVVALHAMNGISIENLQALIILAFDYMGEGQISKTWPIVGSLTRTVEYLRLTVEPEEGQQQPLLRPLILLQQPTRWADVETRRRLFWNVFLLDRFCSVTSGWSTSLTSDDVRRRLPCDGKMWFNGEPAVTPYFGIWDKSAAKIGNSIAFIRALYPSNDQDHMADSSPGGRSSSSLGDADVSKLGAFAYRIESTESLSQVTSFFLQQRVDFHNRQEVGAWLTRFKELDLRLVHWKMFLPQKWKDSNVSRDVAFIQMDPNLTLAHITHNTSMILLHQHIAYPPIEWNDIVKLPSSCSAETCQLAAVETASIAEKYLRHTDGILNSQFAFSAFIAARVFLIHWLFYKTDLAPEFHSVVLSLQNMSQRWRGYREDRSTHQSHGGKNLDIAARYALYLQELHTKCLRDASFYMEILGYSEASSDTGGLLPFLPTLPFSRPFPPQQHWRNSGESRFAENSDNSPSFNSYPRESSLLSNTYSIPHPGYHVETTRSPTTSNPPPQPPYKPYGFNIGVQASQPVGMAASGTGHENVRDIDSTRSISVSSERNAVEDQLTAMSQILLGQQFLELDRVITLEGTDFNFDMNNWGNAS